MTKAELQHTGGNLVTEILVNRYFKYREGSGDISNDKYLAHWAALRSVFPTLSGDPPPRKWFPRIMSWLVERKGEDPTFSPICFRFSTSVIDSDFRYQRGPEWDGSIEQLALRILPLQFSSENPEKIVDSYHTLVLSLVMEMLPALTLDTLEGDWDGGSGEGDPAEE